MYHLPWMAFFREGVREGRRGREREIKIERERVNSTPQQTGSEERVSGNVIVHAFVCFLPPPSSVGPVMCATILRVLCTAQEGKTAVDFLPAKRPSPFCDWLGVEPMLFVFSNWMTIQPQPLAISRVWLCSCRYSILYTHRGFCADLQAPPSVVSCPQAFALTIITDCRYYILCDEQSHCTLLLCNSEWVTGALHSTILNICQSGILAALLGCYVAGNTWNCCLLSEHSVQFSSQVYLKPYS